MCVRHTPGSMQTAANLQPTLALHCDCLLFQTPPTTPQSPVIREPHWLRRRAARAPRQPDSPGKNAWRHLSGESRYHSSTRPHNRRHHQWNSDARACTAAGASVNRRVAYHRLCRLHRQVHGNRHGKATAMGACAPHSSSLPRHRPRASEQPPRPVPARSLPMGAFASAWRR